MRALRIADDTARAGIETAIAALRVKQDRMPSHWHERRAEVGDAIDELVDRWIAATNADTCRTCGLSRARCEGRAPRPRVRRPSSGRFEIFRQGAPL